MKLYSQKEQYKLYHGNMLDMAEVIEPNSIDSIVCDPPYELNFMGKGWDNSGIAFNKDAWAKCYDVLKPGGYLLAFGGTRTYHRIACAIEDAGFEIRDCIMYLYGSGFPKSLDISKAIDKKNNKTAESRIKLGEVIKNNRLIKNLTQRELGNLIGVSRELINLYEIKGNNQQQIPTKDQWNKIKEILSLDNNMDYIYEEIEREVVGKKISGGASAWINGANNKENSEYNYTGQSEWDITKPSTDLAKQWNGWGTALKPAYEPIIVARKPFKTSVAENIMQYGVGGINIDECRVGDELMIGESAKSAGEVMKTGLKADYKSPDRIGRFPANVIHDGSEEAIKDMPNTDSGKPHTRGGTNFGIGIEKDNRINEELSGFNDSGSASRYFYCAKASKKDRDEGLDMFDSMQVNDGRETSIDNAFQRGDTLRKNIHPTVKPIELMQYLVRLVTPKNGTILDCFMGSGSTGKATMFENREREANYKFIGIELTEEYLPICAARIDYALNKYEYDFKKELEEAKRELGQQNIFEVLEDEE